MARFINAIDSFSLFVGVKYGCSAYAVLLVKKNKKEKLKIK
jgi:hypothetical protein